MGRLIGWQKAGLGAALLAAIAIPEALLAKRAAPERFSVVLPARVAAGKTFAAVCSADGISDSRPIPAWVEASFSDDNCRAPPMPRPLDGYKATREQIVAGMTAVKRYGASADAYQKCIADFVASGKAQALNANTPVKWPVIVIENHRILVSQLSKKKAHEQMNVAINAFNQYGSECPEM